MLDLCLLGCGGMMPLPRRWLTALMMRYNGSSLLIDCGEGTQVAIDQTAFSVAGKLRDIDVIVTDRKPSDKWLAHFADEGVECRYPGMQS